MTQNEPRSDTKHAAWIAMKVKATLSHYPEDWKQDSGVRDLAMDDWLDFLAPYSKKAIDLALSAHLRDQPRSKPTPGDIRARAAAHQTASATAQKNPRDGLTYDELQLLNEKVLPTAKRWLQIPGLRDYAESTLRYWGEA